MTTVATGLVIWKNRPGVASVSVNDERPEDHVADRDAMKDPPPVAELRRVKNTYEWINTWRYVIVQPSVKSVGLAAATFANKDGTSVRPGVARLMTITGYSNRAVVDALTTLRWLGFLWRAKAAVRTPEGGNADEYWLCLPADMSRVPIADPKTGIAPALADLTLEARSVAEALGVGKKLGKGLSELSSRSCEVSSSDRVISLHNTNPSTNSIDHAAGQQAGARASSRAAGDENYRAFVVKERAARTFPGVALTEDDEIELMEEIDYDYVVHVVGDLDAMEESTARGMLFGMHPRAVVNEIRRMRGYAA